VPALIHMLPAEFPLPRKGEIAVDPAVLAFTFSVSLGCGLFFGIFPAMQVNRGKISDGLRQGGRHGSAGNRAVRSSLVIAEIALALLLVIGAGLLLRSFLLLNSVDPGFRPDGLTAFRMVVMAPGKTFDQMMSLRAERVRQMLEHIRALPDVASASSIHLLPMTGMQSGSWVHRSDRPAPAPGTEPLAEVSVISGDYFRTMGIRMIAGREFDERDRGSAPWALIINQAAARQFYPSENPIGKHMVVSWGMIDPPQKDFEIVGVAADMRQDALDVKPQPCMFLAQTQGPSPYCSLLVRSRGKPAALISEVKEQVRLVSASQGIQDVQSMDTVIGDSIARPKLEVAILGIFGLVALALACVGIYAVISYSVQQRTREMGIRLALGAAPRLILNMVLREGLLLAAAGIGTGLLAALVLTRYLQSLLYTIRPTDPEVYGSVTAVLVVAAAAGCYFPARRATRVDPAVVLREE
jgi:putative ABC transport system permease protein